MENARLTSELAAAEDRERQLGEQSAAVRRDPAAIYGWMWVPRLYLMRAQSQLASAELASAVQTRLEGTCERGRNQDVDVKVCMHISQPKSKLMRARSKLASAKHASADRARFGAR